MTRSELLALPRGARVTVKSGKIYRVLRVAERFDPTRASTTFRDENPDGFAPPEFQQWRTGEAKFPNGRLYGPSFVRLKAENVTLVVDAPAPPVSAKTAAFLAEVAAELPPPPPVSRRAAAPVVEAPAADVVTVTISAVAAQVAGWDDRCLISDMARTWKGRDVVLSGDRATLSYAADVLGDYGDPLDLGADVSAARRRSARVGSEAIRAALRAAAIDAIRTAAQVVEAPAAQVETPAHSHERYAPPETVVAARRRAADRLAAGATFETLTQAERAAVHGEEFNPNDAVSAARAAGRPDPSPADLDERARRFATPSVATVFVAATATRLRVDLDVVRAFVAANPDGATAVLAAVQGGLDVYLAAADRDRLASTPGAREAVALMRGIDAALDEAVRARVEVAPDVEVVVVTDRVDDGVLAAARAFRRSSRVED